MRTHTDSPGAVDVVVTTDGRMPGADEYAQAKIGGLIQRTHQPVLYARVRVSHHGDPAVACPVVAQANLDLNGRPVRVQVEGANARSAIDQLEARLRRRLERLDRFEDTRRGRASPDGAHEWRHQSLPTRRPRYFPRPMNQRRVIRRKSFTLGPCSVDEAAEEMELLDYHFHLFTEEATHQACVLYRYGPSGYRLELVKPSPREELAPFDLPVGISPRPAPCLTFGRAAERLGFLGHSFLFFIDAAEGRACVPYAAMTATTG